MATLVFIHLPRTGGTTFQQLVERRFARGESLRINSLAELEEFKTLPPEAKQHIKFLHGHMGLELLDAPARPYHCVTFLREPVARVASAYDYLRKNPEHTHYQTVTTNNLSLAEYIRRRVSVINIDNGMTRLLSGEPDNAAHIPFGQCTRAMLDAARQNLRDRVSVVGLTEQFDASLVLMRRHFRWKSPLYTSQNQTRASSAQRQLNPEEIELIQEHNLLDLELYSYAKGLFRRQMLGALPWIPVQVRYFKNKNRLYAQDRAAFKQLRQFESKRIARWLDLK